MIFDRQGNFRRSWGEGIFPRAHGITMCPDDTMFLTRGQLLARLGGEGEGETPGRFIAPHGVCIDSRGDIYVGEVSWTHTGSRLNPPREVRSLQKLARQG